MFIFQVKKDSEAPVFGTASRYDALYNEAMKLGADEWLVITGFNDIDDLRDNQASIRSGGSTRRQRKYGFKLRTRAYTNDGRLELWCKVVPVATEA